MEVVTREHRLPRRGGDFFIALFTDTFAGFEERRNDMNRGKYYMSILYGGRRRKAEAQVYTITRLQNTEI